MEPQAAPPSAPRPARADRSHGPSERRRVSDKTAHLLVVDDEAEIRDLLEETFLDEGFRVATARDVSDALEKLRETDFDLLITDVLMPGGSGLDMLREVKRIRPHIATIVMTGHADTDKAVQALREKVDDFVQKPFTLEELLHSVRVGLAAKGASRVQLQTIQALRRRSTELARERTSLSTQISEATEQVGQFKQKLTRNSECLGTVSDLSKVITSVLDLDKALNLCLALLNQRLQVNRSSIMLYDHLSDSLEVVAARGADGELVGERQAIGEGVSGFVAKTRQPILIEDIREDGRFDTSRADAYETGSFMCAPLVFQDELLGVINTNDRTSGEPFDEGDLDMLHTIARQLATAIANARLYDNLKENSIHMVEALANTLEAKDVYTCGHSERVTEYAVRLGDAIGLAKDQLDTLRFGGLLHDIGKIGVPEEILRKPGRLTDEEYTIVQQHPVIGERIIGALDFLSDVRTVVRHHHERHDGRGYPDKLSSAQVTVLPKVLSITDAFDAMTSERSYRSALSIDDALTEVGRNAGSQFDPAMVGTFLQLFEEDSDIKHICRELRLPTAKRL